MPIQHEIACAIKVVQAAPATPNLGIIPQPRINIGSIIKLSMTVPITIYNGIFTY